MYRQRGRLGTHSAATSHKAEQRCPASVESVHKALWQSVSPVHAAPGPPGPRAPGMQKTFVPVASSEWQENPGPQSSDEKQGQAVFTAHAPPSQKREVEPPSG